MMIIESRNMFRVCIKHLAVSTAAILVVVLSSCSVQQRISASAKKELINTKPLEEAHIGISLFDPASGKHIYDYQGNKYFVPASNTKIPTCYAAMKYLGDSLIAFRYKENDTAVFIIPAADPSLLHKDFKKQPAIEWLGKTKKNLYLSDANWDEKPLGYGWSWDDYNDDYMAERSPLPVYGNIIRWIGVRANDGIDSTLVSSVFSEPSVLWEMNFAIENKDSSFFVHRERDKNSFTVYEGKQMYKEQEIPFVTDGLMAAAELLPDTIGKNVSVRKSFPSKIGNARTGTGFSIIHSQPTDSILAPMMHRSDNFFAEQALLMVSNEKLGRMNDAAIIDTILKTDFKDLPQQPNWVDGSGLSRYNLFSPQDFIAILDKMQREFGVNRIKAIFPSGGEGTLSNYYKAQAGKIYAKTGTLSGVVAISGFLYTRKGRQLLFSVLVNNHRSSATAVRRNIEAFLQEIYDHY